MNQGIKSGLRGDISPKVRNELLPNQRFNPQSLRAFHSIVHCTSLILHFLLLSHCISDKYLNWIAADCSKINFESRCFLLEAEEFYSLGIDDPRNLANAKASYIKAIASAKKYRSISDEAYGCELFGYFLLEQKDDTCLGYFVTAQQTFMGWGALKKAAALGDIISKLSGNSTQNDTPNSHQTGMVSPLCGEDDWAAKPCGEDNWATLCNILDENKLAEEKVSEEKVARDNNLSPPINMRGGGAVHNCLKVSRRNGQL